MKIYREIVRNTVMGINAVNDLVPYTDDDALKNVMLSQKEVLEEFLDHAKCELTLKETEDAKGSKLQHTMLKAGVMMNAAIDRSSAHIAKMLMDGYNTGIASIQSVINEMTESGEDVPQSAKDLIRTYDKNIKTLRKYL